MTERSVTLTEELDAFVSSMVESGCYADASEVVRAALTKLEQDDEAKLAALTSAIDEGMNSPDFEGDPFESVRREMGWNREA
jgi:putative addiction module CopG family antidote